MVDWNPIHYVQDLVSGGGGEMHTKVLDPSSRVSNVKKPDPKLEVAAGAGGEAAAQVDPTQQLVDALKKAFPQLAGGGGIPGANASALQSYQHNILAPQLQKSVDAVKGANTQYEAAMKQLLGGSSSPTAKMMLGQMPGVEAMNTGLIQGLNSALVAGPAAAHQAQTMQQQQSDTMKLYDMFQKLMAYVDPAMGQMTGLLSGGGGLSGGLTPQGLQGATGS